MEGKSVKAIVLAAGRGKRMEAERPKQYLELLGHEVLYYSLKAFEESCVDEVILVKRRDRLVQEAVRGGIWLFQAEAGDPRRKGAL